MHQEKFLLEKKGHDLRVAIEYGCHERGFLGVIRHLLSQPYSAEVAGLLNPQTPNFQGPHRFPEKQQRTPEVSVLLLSSDWIKGTSGAC